MALPLAIPNWSWCSEGRIWYPVSLWCTAVKLSTTRAQNQAAVNQYKQRLKIRDKEYKDSQQLYATKLGQYNQQMSEFDRAAAQGYGREQCSVKMKLFVVLT